MFSSYDSSLFEEQQVPESPPDTQRSALEMKRVRPGLIYIRVQGYIKMVSIACNLALLSINHETGSRLHSLLPFVQLV